MSEKGWNILISVVGMLMIVAIYGFATYFMEKRWARQDKEREARWNKFWIPEPEPKEKI